jgi:hypothetical protein
MLGALLLNQPQGAAPPAGPPKENIVILGYGIGPLIVTIGLVGGSPATSAAVPKENIVILGYGRGPLIPTIGLVGGPAVTPPIPPTPPAGGPPQFGGGPFWREYGYDSAYDAIRDQTSTTAGPARAESEAPPFIPKAIDYHFIQSRAFGSVANEMRAFWETELADQRRVADEEEELMIVLSLLE